MELVAGQLVYFPTSLTIGRILSVLHVQSDNPGAPQLETTTVTKNGVTVWCKVSSFGSLASIVSQNYQRCVE